MSKRAERRLALLLAGLAAASGAAPTPALGHAALVEAEAVEAVRVEGRFESGEPMAGAQVTVYAPSSPTEPWQQGQTDARGVFLFVPESEPGRWAVRLRQAGHGGMAYLDLGPEAAMAAPATATAATPSTVQKTVMAACVVWGCIGTALYFRRSRAG